MQIDRRAWMKQAAMASAAVCAFGSGAGGQETADQQKIVDTHQHLWDTEVVETPSLRKGNPRAFPMLMGDYLKAAKGLNVTRTVYMEVAVLPEYLDKEVEYVTKLCEADDNPMVAAVIGGRPADPNFAEYLAKHKDNTFVRGVRQILHERSTPAGTCLKDEFVAGVRELGKIDWTFDLCLRRHELEDGAKLIELCPDTRFILDHCGNESVLEKDHTKWQKGIDAVAAKNNVIAKISGVIYSGPNKTWSVENLTPIINHTLDAFGPDRVVFGSDWPVCTFSASYIDWVRSLKTIVAGRSAEERRKLFHDNAVRLYRLPEEKPWVTSKEGIENRLG